MAYVEGGPQDFEGPDDPDREIDILEQFKARRKEAENALRDWQQGAQDDFDFYGGKQWSNDDLAKLANEFRPGVTMNRIAPIVDAVSGSETTNRYETRFLPLNFQAGDIDQQLSEVMGAAYKWGRSRSNQEHVESGAFRDALTCGIGVTEKYVDYDENPDGVICVKRINPLEVLWDPSAQEQNLLDARYIIRGKWIPEDEFRALFPERADEFFALTTAGPGGAKRMWDATTKTRDNGRDVWMARSGGYYDARARMVLVFEYQWSEKRREVRIDVPGGEPMWVSEQEAPVVIAQLQQQLAMQAMMQAQQPDPQTGMPMPPQAPPPVDFVQMPHKRYYRAFIAGDVLLDWSESEVESFTYRFITCYEHRQEDGRINYTGLVFRARDAQKLLNKFISTSIHIWASDPKGAVLYEDGALANPNKAASDWTKPGAMIKLNPGGIAKIQQVPAGRNFGGTTELFNLAEQGIPLTIGVNEQYFTGAAEDLRRTASTAITSLQSQTLKVLATPFDSLRMWRKEDGRLWMKFARKYMSDKQLVRVLGPDGNPQVVPFVKDWAAGEYDIVVDEAPTSPNKQKEFTQMVLNSNILPQLIQMGVPIPPEVVDLFDFPEAFKQALRTGIAQQQAAQQAAQQQGAQPAPDGSMPQ